MQPKPDPLTAALTAAEAAERWKEDENVYFASWFGLPEDVYRAELGNADIVLQVAFWAGKGGTCMDYLCQ
jgi:hypothetical protein